MVSHPADSLVSLMGKAENKGKRWGAFAHGESVKSTTLPFRRCRRVVLQVSSSRLVAFCRSFAQMAGEFGYGRLFTKGLGTRVLMIGTLTGLQWWIYDTFKVSRSVYAASTLKAACMRGAHR